jgi:hypothetical protein
MSSRIDFIRQPKSSLIEFKRRAVAFGPLLLGHAKTHWTSWLFAILAFYFFQANYTLGYNVTPSLPYKIFLIHLNPLCQDRCRLLQGECVNL